MVAVITCEQFVAAVAGERNRDVLPRHRGYEISRDLRGIGERLVEPLGQIRNDVERLFRGHGQFGVLGAEMPRHRGSVRRFIEAFDIEADGEGLHAPSVGFLHQRHDR